jgi:hypothetical protein
MTSKCPQIHIRVRHFTRVTFAMMLWSLVNAYWLVHELGPVPYYLALLALTFLGTCVVGLNLVRLQRLLRDQDAPDVPNRGYLVPVLWTIPPNNEQEVNSAS